MNKPNVLMIGPSRDMQGGVASVINGYIEGGLGEFCNLTYIGTACDGSKIRKILAFITGFTRFRQELCKTNVVHIHTSMRASFYRKYYLAKACKNNGVRLVIHEHDGEFAKVFESADESYRSKVREFFSWADAVIVLSEEWRDYFIENVCDAEKIIVMHNAVSLPKEPIGSYEHQDVLFLGRLGACKSPEVLLQAAKALRTRHPGVRYRFAGDGNIEKYKTLANKLGVADRCDFVGWVTGDEKECLVRKTGIFCLPSRHEGMPMSMLEMMSYGIPCVMTPVGGIPQVIIDGENGYMFPVGDSEALASCLDDLLCSADLRRAVGLSARKTIAAKFDLGTNIELLGELYVALQL